MPAQLLRVVSYTQGCEMLGEMNGLGSGRSSDRTSPAEGCPKETQVCPRAEAEAQVRVSGGKAGSDRSTGS